MKSGKLVNQGTKFATATKQVLGVFAFQNMRDGMKWGVVWQYNGQVAIDQRNDGTWKNGAKGTTGVSLALDQGLPDGNYDLQLYINNKVVQQGSFVVGNPTADPTPQPPTNNGDTGVTLKGQIVDADTQKGIPNALILILKPGVKLSNLTNANLQQNTAAAGQADQAGFYITAPGIARGKKYSVLVLADKYQPGTFEDGLTIGASDADLLEVDPIPLTAK